MLRSARMCRAFSIVLLLCGAFFIPQAWAGCCPSDGNGAPKAASGMGESFPAALNLSLGAEWQVYEFERDGIRYTQVNDQFGVVRVAIGRIEDTFWVLPIGQDADSVELSVDALPAVIPQIVFRSDEVEVLLYQEGIQRRWLVRSPNQSQ